MKIIVLGCGFIGSVIATDLAESQPSAHILVADKNPSRALDVALATGKRNICGMGLDVQNPHELVGALKRCDLVVGALPGDIGYHSVRAAISAGVDMVDVSYMPENPLDLNKDAEEAGVTVIPDCGVAPGISNVLIGHSMGQLDNVKNIHVMVGGLPERPIPPLGYTITWSSEGLIDEYTRSARIVRKGVVMDVEALTGLETIDFPGVGRLEAFYTDGLRTLTQTVKGVENMWEKTLRYPGHLAEIKLLRDLGFFSEHPVEVDGTALMPRKLTAKLLEARLRKPEMADLLALRVEVQGERGRKEASFTYHLLDRCDRTRKVSAMARTTAYPASILAQFLGKGDIQTEGVVPLETLSMEDELYKKIMVELENREIKVVSQTRF